jgi:hypothetical protein
VEGRDWWYFFLRTRLPNLRERAGLRRYLDLLIKVAQVTCFAHAVVAGAVEQNAVGLQSARGVGKRGARWKRSAKW